MLPQLVRAYRNHPVLAIPYSTCGSSVFPETATEDSCSLLLLDQRFLRRLHALPSRTQGPSQLTSTTLAARPLVSVTRTCSPESTVHPDYKGFSHTNPSLPHSNAHATPTNGPPCPTKAPPVRALMDFNLFHAPTCQRPQVIRFYPRGGSLQLKALSCISFS